MYWISKACSTTFNLWIEPQCVTILMKAIEQYFQQHFHRILFLLNMSTIEFGLGMLSYFMLTLWHQEDEVDGIDPIIRVWNLDKVFFCSHSIIFHSCHMLTCRWVAVYMYPSYHKSSTLAWIMVNLFSWATWDTESQGCRPAAGMVSEPEWTL